MSILESASKIVLILIAITLCFAISWNIVKGNVIIDAQYFKEFAIMVFVYYFSNKGDASNNYLGK